MAKLKEDVFSDGGEGEATRTSAGRRPEKREAEIGLGGVGMGGRQRQRRKRKQMKKSLLETCLRLCQKEGQLQRQREQYRKGTG